MDELRNCPFCGGPATILGIDDSLAWNGRWVVECGDCTAEMSLYYTFDPTKTSGNRQKEAQRKEVILDWNRRV